MPSVPSVVVDVCTPAPDRLPDELVESALLLGRLKNGGFFAEVGRRLQLRRKSGSYVGVELVAFLVAYHASGLICGLKQFVERFVEHGSRLAAITGRRRWPGTSSVSRLARSVQDESLDDVVQWLLCDAVDPWALLAHPSVQTRDHRGEGWHVFDLDHTRLALLRRPLPRGDDLPEPKRVSEDFAAPGYAVVNRAALQHAGSSLWLDCRLSAGNPPNRADLDAAPDIVPDVVRRAGGDPTRTVLRLDGAFGHVPHITACLDKGVPFVTRIARYDLLDQADVRESLASSGWRPVPSSGAGPDRFATELGQVWLRPALQTRRDDGSEYAQVEVRVVVTRRRARDGDGHGRVLDGWLYELYATCVDAADWPDHELVALYAGRAGQENRFAQEDRELSVERIASYHLPGQRLSSAVGLMVWNLRVCQGFELRTPPVEPPPPLRREAEPRRLPRLAEPDDADAGQDAGERRESDDDGDRRSLEERRRDADSALLRCPAGKTLRAASALKRPDMNPTVNFQARRKDCFACPTRSVCTSTVSPSRSKRVSVSVRRLDHESLTAKLDLLRSLDHRPQTLPDGGPPPSRTKTAGNARPLSWSAPSQARPPTGTAPTLAWFAPAEARRGARDLCRRLEVHVRVGRPKELGRSRGRPHRGTTSRTRRTWTERTAVYALPPGTPVKLRCHGLGDRGRAIAGFTYGESGATP